MYIYIVVNTNCIYIYTHIMYTHIYTYEECVWGHTSIDYIDNGFDVHRTAWLKTNEHSDTELLN